MRSNPFTPFILAVIAACLAGVWYANAAPAPKAAEPSKQQMKLDLGGKVFQGDYDEMVQRRVIRVATVPSKTFFFIDKGTPRGLVYDSMRQLEDDINKKIKAKALRVTVVFIPLSRSELLPADNVERVAAEKIGRETVGYVSNIYKYYVAYSLVRGEYEQRIRAREQLAGAAKGTK